MKIFAIISLICVLVLLVKLPIAICNFSEALKDFDKSKLRYQNSEIPSRILGSGYYMSKPKRKAIKQ